MLSEEPFHTWLVVLSLAILPMMMYHRLKSRTNEKLDRRQEGMFILMTLRPIGLATMGALGVYLIKPALMAWASAGVPEWLRWSGVATGCAAGLLLFWTVHTLGPNLTDTVVTRRDHTLVTAGPYQWVRHPFYGCITLLLVAFGLGAANGFILTGGMLVVALLIVRTDAEEARLVSRFGEGYRTYMQRTGRFLPGVGRAHSRA